MNKGDSRKKLYINIFRRAVILFLFGLLMNGWLGFDLSNLKWTGVLQRISIAYFFSALIVINTRVQGQFLIAGSLLVLYWLLMTMVPVPGYGAGIITPEGNLHGYIDRLFLPGKMYNEFYDEDGVLQQLFSISVCLAGVVTGQWLQTPRTERSKVGVLLLAGIACIIIALLWHLSFPIIFRLWSSSFALLTIGISAVLMGFFYWIIDVKGYDKWAFPFIVVGLNSITIYIVSGLFDFRPIINVFIHGFVDNLGTFKPVFWALCLLTIKWLLLYFLYKKKIFLKI